MAGETTLTIIGNLVADPEIRFTDSGTAVAKFRVASTPRIYDRNAGQWVDGEPLFLTCTVWRQVAEHVCESLQRGMRVIVQSRMRQRTYTDREGIERTVVELDVDDVGLSLRQRIAYTEQSLPPALADRAATAPQPAAAAPPVHTARSNPQGHRDTARPRRRTGWHAFAAAASRAVADPAAFHID